VTSRTVGRHPIGTCANRRSTVSRAAPSTPQRPHQLSRSRGSSGSRTRHASTVWSSPTSWPVTVSPIRSIMQNASRSGQSKVGSATSRSSRWAVSELPSSEDLDPHPRTDAPNPATPWITKSPQSGAPRMVCVFPSRCVEGNLRLPRFLCLASSHPMAAQTAQTDHVGGSLPAFPDRQAR